MKRWLLVLGVLLPVLASAQALECAVEGSDDHFILYPWQQIYQSDDHRIYALMGGRTVAVVQRQTLRFNRITSLNLLPVPDRLQQFTGRCQVARSLSSAPAEPTPR